MAAPRAVRIVRPPVPPVSGVPVTSELSSRKGTFFPNQSGTQRGLRLFLVFLAVLATMYAVFVSLILTSAAAAAGPTLLIVLGVVAALFTFWAWTLTWGRAPRGVRWMPDGSIRVLERTGAHRRFLGPPELQVNVAYRYPASFLNRGPVEMVEVSAPETRRRAYLVDAGLFNRPIE